MDGDQFGAVGERGLDLNFRDHFRDALHHLFAGQQGGAQVHQVGHGPAVASAFKQGCGNVGHGLRVIEFHAASQTPLGHQAGGEDQQLVFFAWGQVHCCNPYSAVKGVGSVNTNPTEKQFRCSIFLEVLHRGQATQA
ncbi:hypothetical protein D3C78_1345310 [compost metagenome]